MLTYFAQQVWMCGGSLEVLPCSRMGHLYRTSTYSFGGDAAKIKLKNNVRLVEVWMDEYKDFFYVVEPGNIHTNSHNPLKSIKMKFLQFQTREVFHLEI